MLSDRYLHQNPFKKIVNITNVWLFEAKLAAGTLAIVVSAWLVYRRKQPVAMASE